MKFTIKIWSPTAPPPAPAVELIRTESTTETFEQLDQQPPPRLTGRIEVETPKGTIVVKES